MALYDSELARAISELGRYFGVISKEKFAAILASPESSDMSSINTISDFDDTSELEKVMRVFLDMTEGGVIMRDSFEELVGLIKDGDESVLQAAQNLYMYVGETKAFESVYSDSEVVCSNISISDVCDLANEKGKSNINSSFSSPSKDKPNLCAIEVYNPRLVPASRDTAAAALFMSSIPTYELSRCQPRLEITVVSPRPGIESGTNRIQTLSLMQHILGQSKVDQGADSTIASAVDSNVFVSTEFGEDIATAGMEIFTAPQTLVPMAGNQLAAHGNYAAYSDIKDEDGNRVVVGSNRGENIIDPFRPLMSIQDFKVKVSPSRGMISHKTADLSIVLHDRSRMTEIAEFVKPDLFGKTELLITYGWAHPDVSLSDGGSLFGKFLNAMSVTEKYVVINSSFSFDEVGQVSINLQLSMKGSNNMDVTKISQGEGVELKAKAVDDLISAIKDIKKNITDSLGTSSEDSSDVFGGVVFETASSTSRAMVIDKKTQKEIKKYIASARGSASPDSKKLADKLSELFGDKGAGGVAQELRETISSIIEKKKQHIKSIRPQNKDPFNSRISKGYVEIPYDSSDHISLGALILYMVGKPLASTGNFDEVQFVFYPMNDKSSFLKDFTVAQIPIRIKDFMDKYETVSKTDVNMPLGRFINFISKEFVHNQQSEFYGLRDLYELSKKEKKRVLRDKYKKDPGLLKSEKDDRLRAAYGPGAELVFKMPRIRFHIETVPGIRKTSSSSGDEITSKSAQTTIMRVHIYDSVCTQYSSISSLLSAAKNNQLSLLNTTSSKVAREAKFAKKRKDAVVNTSHARALKDEIQKAVEFGLLEPALKTSEDYNKKVERTGDVKQLYRIKGGFKSLKDFIQSTMPTIIYGTSNSAIITANVSSMNDSKLASVNMLRSGLQGGMTAVGARDAGVPLQVAPVSLSLNIIGCPIVNYAQSFFVDFGTGTTVDNVYSVTGIEHAISQGKFDTSLTMVQVDAFGKYVSTIDTISKAITALTDIEQS